MVDGPFNLENQYREQLAQFLPPARIQHSVNVANSARELARRFHPELEGKAWVAGMLHDNAKYMPPPELVDQAQARGIEISPGEHRQPALLHGKVGAALLTERFNVDDNEIAQAVADHVTGRRGMGPLSMVLYVADQIAEDRKLNEVVEIRGMAEKHLEKAAAMVCRFKLRYVMSQGKPIVMETVELYNELNEWLRDGNG